MIPISAMEWTTHTATVRGQVLKLVPCENCLVEYVYVLKREGTGVGTTISQLDEEGAERHAASAADETLREYLANDFDPVPCPRCGHYQRYMFPKLYGGGPVWVLLARLAAVGAAAFNIVAALHWGLTYLTQPDSPALLRLAILLPLAALFGLAAYGLTAFERSRARRFDPNTEDQQARIEKGKCRAVTREEFETGKRNPPD